MSELYDLLENELVQALFVSGLTWLATQVWKWARKLKPDEAVPEKQISAGVSAVALALIGEFIRARAPEADPFSIAKVITVALPGLLLAFGIHGTGKNIRKARAKRSTR